MAANDVKYVEEASKALNVPTLYLEGFIDFIIKLDDEKLHMLLNSSQTGITENIGKFLYNLHYHHIIKFNTDEGGLKRFSEDEIARLAKYINNVAEKIKNIKQEKAEEVKEPEEVKEEVVAKEETVKEATIEESIAEKESSKEEAIEEISPEVADLIERGKKIVPEDKKAEWENYIKKTMTDMSPLKPDFSTILGLMEEIKNLEDYSNIGTLVNKRKYSIYMYDNLKKVMKEFLNIDIDEYQQEEEPVKLKSAKVEEKPSSVLDGIDTTNMTDSQKAIVNEISKLENKKQEKEQELAEAQKKLQELQDKYAVKDNLYTTAVYGLKSRCEAQITNEAMRINSIMDEARKAERELKHRRNRRLIFSKASDWANIKSKYAAELEAIRIKRNKKIEEPSEEIRKQNIEIEEAKKGLRMIGKSIKEQEGKIEDITYEIYEIKIKLAMAQRLLENPSLLDKPNTKEEADYEMRLKTIMAQKPVKPSVLNAPISVEDFDLGR